MSDRVTVVLRSTIAAVIALGCAATFADELSPTLTLLDRYRVKDKKAGLDEPSGLALATDEGLWTISDDSLFVFKIDFKGDIDKDGSFPLDAEELKKMEGMEGICLSPDGKHIFAVDEDNNRVLKFEPGEEKPGHRKLSDMDNYDTIKDHFDNGEQSKGLEGITYNEKDDTIIVVKEGYPGLLIELTADLKTIKQSRLLTDEKGFVDDDPDKKVDFSGLCYDRTRHGLWIVSDDAERIYLYDWMSDQVMQSFALGYGKKGKYRAIESAEGIAVDTQAGRLYIVTDDGADLYIFDLR